MMNIICSESTLSSLIELLPERKPSKTVEVKLSNLDNCVTKHRDE